MTQVNIFNLNKKKEICTICEKNFQKIKKNFNFKFCSIEDYICNNDLIEADNKVNRLNPENFWEFFDNNLPVGKYSVYEFWLTYKLASNELNKELWPELAAKIYNNLLVLRALKNIRHQVKFERMVCYNKFYSINRLASEYFENLKIPTYNVHASPNLFAMYQKITIFRTLEAQAKINKNPTLIIYRNNPVPRSKTSLIFEHARQYLKHESPWVYSTKTEKKPFNKIFPHIKVSEKTKIIVAVSRSNDERKGAELVGLKIYGKKGIFKDNVEWIRWLIRFAYKNSDFIIIFRVHPREFPNKREGALSENAKMLLSFFEKEAMPNNFLVNFPSDGISLYDLLKPCDLVLNSTSTVGLEASLFVIPVLGYGESLFAFDKHLQEEAEDITDYETKIYNLVQQEWSLAKVINAIRWIHYLTEEVSINIDDCFNPRKYNFNDENKFIVKLKKLFLFPFYLNGLNPQRKKAAEIDKLTFAILNKKESHIGEFSPEFGNIKTELEAIKKDLKIRAESIACDDDKKFLNKINKILA